MTLPMCSNFFSLISDGLGSVLFRQHLIVLVQPPVQPPLCEHDYCRVKWVVEIPRRDTKLEMFSAKNLHPKQKSLYFMD